MFLFHFKWSVFLFSINFCLASVCEFGRIPLAHSSVVIGMNALQVPHIFNHFECHLSDAARTCCNSSHCMTLITGLFFLFVSHSRPEFPFSYVFYFLLSLSLCCHGPCVSMLSPFHKELWYLWPVKWTCVARVA